MMENLVKERQARQSNVEDEIAEKWGKKQNLSGPIIAVPYKINSINERGRSIKSNFIMYYLPENLDISGEMVPEIRSRGIFSAVLYGANLDMTGYFDRAVIKDSIETTWKGQVDEILWEDAKLILKLSDLQSLKQESEIIWEGKSVDFYPDSTGKHLILSAKTPITKRKTDFNLKMKFNGHETLGFTPSA
ncbi:MAG: cell envelope integrity protein CreD, partial [Candidatus Peregrinibacteria bacterium]|nr:cell envelope integrity protein CreD [Candidatus Peregrinibacteria bacterium]